MLDLQCITINDKFKIGEGRYGTVYRGIMNDEPVAIKKINTGGTSLNPRNIFMPNEVRVLQDV